MTKVKFIRDDAMQLQMPLKNTDTDFEWWYFDASSKDGEGSCFTLCLPIHNPLDDNAEDSFQDDSL